MRGGFQDQGGLFSYISPETRVPSNHPLRKGRELVREVLKELTPSLGRLYSSEGRPSVPPEQLFSALLLQVLYGIRSERQLMEQLDYNLLYRWFVGLAPDDPIWVPTTFTKNRDRLLAGDIFAKFMTKLLNHPHVTPLLSDEHFSVDGTLIEAWASQKSFRPKAARREAKLSYMGHVVMENRNGLAVDGMVTQANGTAERRAAETMLKAQSQATGHRITVGADKAYDTRDPRGKTVWISHPRPGYRPNVRSGAALQGARPAERAWAAIATRAMPPKIILMPTSSPSAQAAVPGNPAKIMAASRRSMMPLISIHSQRPDNSRRCSSAYMMLATPSTTKKTIKTSVSDSAPVIGWASKTRPAPMAMTAETSDHQNPGARFAPNVVISPTMPLARKIQPKIIVTAMVANGVRKIAKAPRITRTIPSTRKNVECSRTAFATAAPISVARCLSDKDI